MGYPEERHSDPEGFRFVLSGKVAPIVEKSTTRSISGEHPTCSKFRQPTEYELVPQVDHLTRSVLAVILEQPLFQHWVFESTRLRVDT